jgi:hypothetical protein
MAKAKREKDELEGECAALEEEIEELRIRYEQYFLGVEKRAPARWREELKKKVLRLKSAFTRNSGLKFRIQSLHARFLSYERLWLRGVREKEEGTYRRDLFKARLHRHADEQAPGPAPTPPPEAQRASAATPPPQAPRASSPVAPAAPKKAAVPAAPVPPGMTDTQMRALYDAYIAAKKKCREDVSRLSYDAVAGSVAKQVPELMKRFKARSVEFKVDVKEGRAVLKAIPKV